METTDQRWLARFAWLTAVATWMLVGLGGLVTSKGVGMAVPDWPTSYGYNMFALPVSTWVTGGVFDEHTHRLWASIVGLLVVSLTRWLGGYRSRNPLMLIGAGEILGGLAMLTLGGNWKGGGHFLAGIGGVVLLAGLVWVRNQPAKGVLPALGWTAFVLVQLQGLLGGLRVVLDAHFLGDVRMGTAFGILHGCLGQVFLVVLFVAAVFCSRWWQTVLTGAKSIGHALAARFGYVRKLAILVTVIIFVQLMLGAAMRHQHAGLAVPDFPLAYGKVYPATDADAILRYNNERRDHREFNPITSAQVHLHMAHRFTGLALAVLVPVVAWRFRRLAFAAGVAGAGLANAWMGLVLAQVTLGVLTVLMNKPADVATAHVMIGALLLVGGAIVVLLAREFSVATAGGVMQSPAHSPAEPRRPSPVHESNRPGNS